jgi:hypothetical protein
MIFAQAPAPIVIRESAGWSSPTVVVTIALAIISVVLAIFAGVSARNTKRALDLASDQAAAARLEAQTKAEEQRALLHPWLSLNEQPRLEHPGPWLLVRATVLNVGPGWARIDHARLELPSGANVALQPGVGQTPVNVGEALIAVLPNDDPLVAELKATEFPTLVVHSTNIHGDQGRTFTWTRDEPEWTMTSRADD